MNSFRFFPKSICGRMLLLFVLSILVIDFWKGFPIKNGEKGLEVVQNGRRVFLHAWPTGNLDGISANKIRFAPGNRILITFYEKPIFLV